MRRLSAVVSSLAALVLAAAAPALAAIATIVVPTVSTPPPLDPAAPATAWADAAHVNLTWDVQHAQPATEPATASIVADATTLYVRFDVPQREQILAVQRANEVGDTTDDEVYVDLWPNGVNGFYYQFAANPIGTHWQYSSENTAYSPTWTSFGAAHNGGYTTTMAIPLKALRGAASRTAWKIQFTRIVRSNGERQVWSFGPAQTNSDDVAYAGQMTGLGAAPVTRAKPRVAVYGLGALGSPDSGLTTSRMGADLSVPITPTASIYATLHPDFSNVEVDQQTISPTAFQRQYTEVRPFFTQGAGFYDNFDCDVCTNIAELYTPSIPTPRDGYAFEGKQGPITFAGFDAVGVNRSDGATMMGYQTPDNHWAINTQDVFADIGDLTDHVETTNLRFDDTKHIDVFATYGNDSGTLVLDPSRAQRYEAGFYFYWPTFGVGASERKVGEYYDPLDGYVQQTDIAGYGAFENKLFLFPSTSWLNSIQVGTFISRYHDHEGALDQSSSAGWLDILTRNRIDLQWNFGSQYVRTPSGVFTPATQSGVSATWHSGTTSSPGNNEQHGASATPTTFTYNTGRFGPGRVDAFTRVSTMTAGPRGTVTLEADDTRDYLDPGLGPDRIQWLERFSYTYTPSATASFALGVRRIVGTAPLFDTMVAVPYINAYNLSFDYHKRWRHDELYVAYGDASQLTTVPQFIIKWIHYFGAEKGT